MAMIQVIFLLLFVAYFVIGVVALIALAATLAVAAAIMGVRFWWLGRKASRGRNFQPGQRRTTSVDATVIEGEYRVVGHDKDRERDA